MRDPLAIAGSSVLWLVLALRMASRVEAEGTFALGLVLALSAVACGVLAADLASGVVHFVCDRFFSEHTPLIGTHIIAPFREHHRDPQAIARHGVCERNGNNCLGVAPLLALLHLHLPSELATASAAFAYATLLAMTAALAVTNQVHAWAHGRAVPAPVRRLQRAGLLLSPAMHRAHHERGHMHAYCITTGWLNAVLDRCGAWHALERGLRMVARAGRGDA